MDNDELRKQIDLLKESARLRAEMGNSLEGYLSGLKTMTALQNELARQEKIIAKFFDYFILTHSPVVKTTFPIKAASVSMRTLVSN
jgi:hypothetical protein